MPASSDALLQDECPCGTQSNRSNLLHYLDSHFAPALKSLQWDARRFIGAKGGSHVEARR
jgi:hypothetical protein